MATGTPRARSLAAMLREVLKQDGRSAREIARQLGVSHMTVNRWLSGETAPNSENVADFLAQLGIEGDECDRILGVARASDESPWVISGPPGISPQLASVMDCERTARRITEWSPLVVPGLLQTSAYARHIITRGAGAVSAQEIETRVMVRVARRDALTRPHPVELHALIGSTAIRGGIGGPGVMADQLQYLIDLGKWPSVTLQVVDLAGDWHPGFAGPFIIYEFDDMPPQVYLEHHRTGTFVVDTADVAAYQTAADAIRREAMSPDQAAGLIADAIPASMSTEKT
jgi:transcriptional regulator with XRE-family HTH domain